MLAKASIPRVARDVLRLGRLTALSKPGGRVRGITTGEVMRRLVAKTLAQIYVMVIDQACSPFQCALSTKAGTECIAHTIRAALEADPRATIVSIDGVGTFDLISRRAMLEGLRGVPGAQDMLAFVGLFYPVFLVR
jgi:hypothetical protein